MNVLMPDWPAPPSVRALNTSCMGGVSVGAYADSQGNGGLNLASHVGDVPAAVSANRDNLRELIKVPVAWLNQVHGTNVAHVSREGLGTVPEADASWTSEYGLACAVMTADCLPVLLCDASGTVVAAAHAGWRGLLDGVIEVTVSRLREAGGKDMMAWLGPAIGPQSFEVGTEVRAAFEAKGDDVEKHFVTRADVGGKYLADLYGIARDRLRTAGVAACFGGQWDTFTDQRFYSYRRSGTTGRMASLIWIAPR